MGFKSIALIASTLVLSNSVNAVLIDNGILTLDDETGLQWLDVTETLGMTYAEAGALEGFRYATASEIEDLMSKVLPSYSPTTRESDGQKYMNSSDPSIIAEVEAYQELFGFINRSGGYGTYFYYLDETGSFDIWNATNWLSSIQIAGGPGNTVDASPFALNGNSLYGTYLVASAVPVPAAAWLFGSGLIGLIGVARR